jgi:hypothetical protein
LVPYKPSKIAFEFIGDSFSTVSDFIIHTTLHCSLILIIYSGRYQGYTTPDGILNAWDFLIGETFKAEETVVAQPGATLVVRFFLSRFNVR